MKKNKHLWSQLSSWLFLMTCVVAQAPGTLTWVNIILGTSFLFLAVHLEACVTQFTGAISSNGQSVGDCPLSMKGKSAGLAPHDLILWWASFRDCLLGFLEASGYPYQSLWLAALPMRAACLFGSTREERSCFLARKSSCCLDDWNGRNLSPQMRSGKGVMGKSFWIWLMPHLTGDFQHKICSLYLFLFSS